MLALNSPLLRTAGTLADGILIGTNGTNPVHDILEFLLLQEL